MPRYVAVIIVAVSVCLAAGPALADEAFDARASNVWWAQATGEDTPEQRFHLLPDNTSGPRDWLGLSRDTAFLLGYQIAAAAIIYALPESVSHWSGKDKDLTFEKWWDNARNPHWDDDKWTVNYIAHPYFGATYYTRARERGFGQIESFFYSAFASALFEFGVESIAERPSYQDLIVTPVAGALLGSLVFEPIRSWVKSKADLRWYDHVILIATDPIGALNYVGERLLGIKSTIRVGVPRGGGAFVEIRVPLQ